MKTQLAARLAATADVDNFASQQKKVRSALKKAMHNIKRTTKASGGNLLKMQNDTKAYYGKLYNLYKQAGDCTDMAGLKKIIDAVHHARAARSAKVKTARAPKA